MNIFYEKSTRMAADIYTKGFTSPQTWTAAVELIGIQTEDQRKHAKLKYVQSR